MIRRGFLLLLVLLVILSVSGCNFPESYPIEDVQNILIAGIDMENDEIVLTVLTDTIKQGGKSGEEKIGDTLYTAKAGTVFEAKRLLHEFTEKRTSFYHMKYILIGEDAAKQGINKFLNFFCEDDETKFLYNLFVVKGLSAKGFLEQTTTTEGMLTDKFEALTKEIARTGRSQKIRLLDYAIAAERPWESLYIPTIALYPNPITQTEENEQRSAIMVLEGVALFSGDKLARYLDATATIGLNYILNKVQSTAIAVHDSQNRNVALDLVESKATITVSYTKPLSATIRVSVKSNLNDYQKDGNLLDESYLQYLEAQQNTLIQNEIEKICALLQQSQTDAIGIGDAFYHKNPVKWLDLQDNWKEIFSELKISVIVNSEIQCTYNLLNALG